MKLFLIHAVYNSSEICYRDLINKLEIELLKEKLLNNSPKRREKYLFWQRGGLHFITTASSTKY